MFAPPSVPVSQPISAACAGASRKFLANCWKPWTPARTRLPTKPIGFAMIVLKAPIALRR